MSVDDAARLQEKRRAGLTRMDRLAYWLDDAFRIPVIGKRIGVDGLIGLVPFAGDLVGAGLSCLMIAEALRLGAPRRVWLRMGANVGIDFVVGSIPIAGDVFDVVWRANRRNERVMREWLRSTTGEPAGGGRRASRTTLCLLVAGAGLMTFALWRALAG